MLEGRRSLGILAGAVAVTLSVGVGVATGLVPQAGSDSNPPVIETAAAAEVATEPVVVAAEPETPPDTTPPETVPPTTTPPPTAAPAPKVTAPPTTEPPAPVVVAAPAPTVPPTTVPAIPARLNPTSAQVQAAINQLAPRLPIRPTEAQARDLGNQICTAFDQGQNYPQVKATITAKLQVVPFIVVAPADVDFTIRTAVQLFCPGHASKLQ